MNQPRFISFIVQHYRYLPLLPGEPGNLGTLHQRWQGLTAAPDRDSLIFSDQRRLSTTRLLKPTVTNLGKCLKSSPSIFLFQGYGAQLAGQDYLLPGDGNPETISETGLNFRELIHRFQPFKMPGSLLLLDLAPIPGFSPISTNAVTSISPESLLWAKQRGISVIAIFSQQGQGRLARVFAEALAYYQSALTLELLELFVRSRWEGNLLTGEQLLILTGNHQNRIAPLFPDPTADSPGKTPWWQAIQHQTKSWWKQANLPTLPTVPLGKGILLLLILGACLWGGRFLWLKTQFWWSTADSLSDPERLQQAQFQLRWQQASPFVRAIAKLREIPPESPIYPEAQSRIRQWSVVILAIAKGRAQEENWQDAIAAAKLVPADQTDLHQAAQVALRQWRQQAQQSKDWFSDASEGQ